MIVKLAINVAAWFLAAFAVFYAKVYLYAIVAALNIALGCLSLFCHISGNPTVKQSFLVLSLFDFCLIILGNRIDPKIFSSILLSLMFLDDVVGDTCNLIVVMESNLG